MNTKMVVGWVLAVAAINWGLYGVFGFNLVEMLLGYGSLLSKLAYALIGAVGVYKVYMLTMVKK